ncbi:vitamin B12 ABC transporter ATP-binding protein BtuD [Superficieibacter electus]|uniref:Vitamin B12 import ATP-binding protein BtuD n=1 Tax=Superficieibacter electus TaxID=2022662 RepID=A0A2P5GU46_9ENTR|nr:vitamin B12 ABC transporter ATP-binding protein BtuD [Superficieibacter electus]POP47242.1 vitamin B12 ABC transporter ATP-binding protein BtuD [Superficieibacter electus]POP50088.1 vitamin B12 ABC transporter ATP-binding protein BtuD [Superficieibacter electus]
MPTLLQMRNVEEDGRLGPLSAEVKSGEVIHLVGPNGAGKSTLLSRLAGLTGGKGTILFNDRPLMQWSATVLARHRAFLTQQQTPPFAMPVWHYLKLHQTGQAHEEILEAFAGKLDLSDKLGRQLNQLSGGEWQRVRLCAVILQIHPASNPQGQLLLLDEPMNSLDVAQQAGLDAVLRELSEAGIAIVMSSHDLNHTLRHAHRVWLLRGGKMIACATADKALTPVRLAAAYGMPFRRLEVEGHNILLTGG